MAEAPLELSGFGQDHFGDAYLGDARRTRSLIDLANRFARHPSGTLPHKCKCPNALRRCYDLMKVPAVTHQSVLQPHVFRTLRLIRQQQGVVLALHDGSELDYSGLRSLHPELGQIGEGHGKGYECMNSLAVLAKGRTVLGLLSQVLHVRPHVPKDETQTQRRDRQDRESLLWLKAVDNLVEADRRCRRLDGLDGPQPGESLVVDVADRGSDTFEFLDYEDLLGRKYVLRSQHNRGIRVGHGEGGEQTLLHDYLRGLPEQGSRREINLSEREKRPAREATLAIAWAAVTILLPENRRGNYRKRPQQVWAIRVWEPEPPGGAEAVEWFLLTNLPVATAEQAWEKVEWYCCRWVIEEFHKAQKTGCGIEDPQFTKAARLQPMIALLSVVAAMLLNLRDLSRDERLSTLPATEVIDEELVDILSGWRYGEIRPLSVREFFRALARLGGHQNRKCDGDPGWLVLWRGWIDLQRMVAGARAARAPRPAPPPRAAPSRKSSTRSG
jgi:transposase-like protein